MYPNCWRNGAEIVQASAKITLKLFKFVSKLIKNERSKITQPYSHAGAVEAAPLSMGLTKVTTSLGNGGFSTAATLASTAHAM
jgi:hypothetical protein